MAKRRMIPLISALVLLISLYLPAQAAEVPASSPLLQSEAAALSSSAVAPKKIKITGSANVAKGKKITLTASVSPAEASQKVIWSSSNKKIATVSSKGVVKGIKAGTVTIKAVSGANSRVTKTFKVSVLNEAVSQVKISGAPKSLDLSGTDTAKLKASAQPAKAAQSFTWKSSDPAIATVSADGVVKAKAEGKVTITATAADGSGKKASVKLKVTDSGKTPPKTGWEEEGASRFYYLNGKKVTGWQKIEKKWYFFKPDGALLVYDYNTSHIDFWEILYQDDHDTIEAWEINRDGSYNIYETYFSRVFAEEGEWLDGKPVELLLPDGKKHEVQFISMYLEPDGKVNLSVDMITQGDWLDYSGKWVLREDGHHIQIDGTEYVLAQNGQSFTLKMGDQIIPLDQDTMSGNG